MVVGDVDRSKFVIAIAFLLVTVLEEDGRACIETLEVVSIEGGREFSLA